MARVSRAPGTPPGAERADGRARRRPWGRGLWEGPELESGCLIEGSLRGAPGIRFPLKCGGLAVPMPVSHW